MVRQWFAGISLFPLIAFALAQSADAADLYRVRFEPASNAVAGETLVVDVVLDNSSWPPPLSSESTQSHSVLGFTIGISVPTGLTLSSATSSGTDLATWFGTSDPLHSAESTGENSWFSLVILADEVAGALPSGTGRSIARLTFEVASIPSSPLQFHAGDSTHPTTLMTVDGPVVPIRGTLGWNPSGSSQVSDPTPNAQSGPHPYVGPEIEVADDPLAAGAEVGAEGGGLLLGGGSQPDLSDDCQYDTLLGLPSQTPPLDSVDRLVTQGGPISIQDAIDDGVLATGDWVIEVAPGTYLEALSIDLGDFVGRTLYIFATGGPDNTILSNPVAGFAGDPALTVVGTGTNDGDFVLGWVNSTNTSAVAPASHAGWYGLRITSSGAGGVINRSAVELTNCRHGAVKMFGNWFDGNPDPSDPPYDTGGAIQIVDSQEVEIVFNEFSDNMAEHRGAAIYCADSRVFFANNWIHDNVFQETSIGTVPRFGGGIYMDRGSYTLCRNFIYENNAIRGGGVYANVRDAPFEMEQLETIFHMEKCELRENLSYLPRNPVALTFSYAGGGAYIEGLGGVETPPTPYRHEFRLINNLFRDNRSTVFDSPGFDPGPQPAEMGGGLFLDYLYTFDNDSEMHAWISGNHFAGNFASLRGAGADLGFWHTNSTALDSFVQHNTIAGNQILERTAGASTGSGLYMHEMIAFGFILTPWTDCQNAILWDNSTTGSALEEWFVECGNTGLPTGTGWKFSVLPQYTLGSCATSGVDIFKADSVDADPGLAGLSPYDSHITEDSVAAIDFGNPAATHYVGVDFDGDSRVHSIAPDRGADEFIHDEFLRGDPTGDGTINIADFQAIWTQIFSGGAFNNCIRSGDSNGDGHLNVGDAVYLSNDLFSSGPPPPSPWPLCGLGLNAHGPTSNVPYEPCGGVCP